jgi:hypothetical protein
VGPADVLAGLRDLVGRGGRLVFSIINFQADYYADPSRHHDGWVFKPTLAELRRLAHETGWCLERVIGFRGRRGWREWTFRTLANRLGYDHPWTLRRARQFLLIAAAS